MSKPLSIARLVSDLLSSVSGKGAALVGFIQSGTGAVARTVRDKAREAAVSPEDYGAVGDAVEGSGTTLTGTDDTPAFLAALTALDAGGGGTLQCAAGKVYKLTGQITLPAGVRLNLNEAKLVFQLANATDCGVQLRSNTILENGHIRVISTGSPASQASAHAPVRLGALYGEGGAVAAPSADDNASGWAVRNLIVESNKDLGAIATGGAAGIAIMGNCYNGLVEGITVPDNDYMTVGIAVDWGTRGEVGGNQAIVSSAAAMATNKANFLAGDGFTTHPHDILITNVNIGQLNRALSGAGATSGSFGVRTSGCYGVEVSNVLVAKTTEAAFLNHAGDLGFEFAQAADLAFALMGNSWTNCKVINASTGAVIQCDSTADNVQTAITSHAYTPLHAWGALWPTDITWRQVGGTRTSGAASFGLNIYDIDGGRFIDCYASNFIDNLRLSGAESVVIEGGRFATASANCILIEDSSANCILRNIRECHTAGASNFVVRLSVCDGVTIDGGSYGIATGETGTHTIVAVDAECTNLSFINTPTILGHGSGSFALIAGADSTQDVWRIFGGVDYGPGVTSEYFGQRWKPYARPAPGVIHATTTGTPTGNVDAALGSTMTRTDGGAGTTFYVKQTAAGDTTWAAVA